jgi:hypothetical protein
MPRWNSRVQFLIVRAERRWEILFFLAVTLAFSSTPYREILIAPTPHDRETAL